MEEKKKKKNEKLLEKKRRSSHKLDDLRKKENRDIIIQSTQRTQYEKHEDLRKSGKSLYDKNWYKEEVLHSNRQKDKYTNEILDFTRPVKKIGDLGSMELEDFQTKYNVVFSDKNRCYFVDNKRDFDKIKEIENGTNITLLKRTGGTISGTLKNGRIPGM